MNSLAFLSHIQAISTNMTNETCIFVIQGGGSLPSEETTCRQESCHMLDKDPEILTMEETLVFRPLPNRLWGILVINTITLRLPQKKGRNGLN